MVQEQGIDLVPQDVVVCRAGRDNVHDQVKDVRLKAEQTNRTYGQIVQHRGLRVLGHGRWSSSRNGHGKKGNKKTVNHHALVEVTTVFHGVLYPPNVHRWVQKSHQMFIKNILRLNGICENDNRKIGK